MQLLPRPSSKAISAAPSDRLDPTLPIILEYQSPSSAIVNLPMPRIARGFALTFSSMLAVMMLITGLISVDRVVTAGGLVVARSPTIVVQPLEASILRSIEVHPGDIVHAGEVLARLDPTFAQADLGTLVAQVSSLQAEVTRRQAEMNDKPFRYEGNDSDMTFQAAVYSERQAEYNFKLENYQQKIDSLSAALAKANSDIGTYTDRLGYAKSLEAMRLQLEQLNVGSKLNTLSAKDSRAEMAGNLATARQQALGAQRDLAAMIAERNGYIQGWHSDTADKLNDVSGKLSDARQSLNKAQLRRQLVVLRAERDGTVMSVGKVSVGSVLTAGQQLITLVPTDAPLEIEANIAGSDDGYVHVGDAVDIKFDTFPYSQYGLAHGVVRTISPDSFSPQDEQRNPTGAVPLSPQAGGVFYRARVTLDQIQLHGTPPGFHLLPGMPVHADIRVGKQTVLRYMMGKTIPLATEGMREP
ncbi:HlyD family type I secretion periplasmic adaptor subunit [Acidisphaera sp. S103]|uniref:HlyD family type I secretion periplasmic adaptor subunit n=1 Tax=Acidisphaera sp. S103 TaxID=1747223 RepID=UPI00131C677A|nr:HlyD family type I secretion periplasmic adaptor subunit [Acidisphaera sp. S103]